MHIRKIYSWVLIAVIAGSSICAIVVDPTGEGFVRGINVVFAFFISSAVVWLVTAPAVVFLIWRCFAAKAIKAPLAQEGLLVALTALGVITPLINGILIRIKAVFQ